MLLPKIVLPVVAMFALQQDMATSAAKIIAECLSGGQCTPLSVAKAPDVKAPAAVQKRVLQQPDQIHPKLIQMRRSPVSTKPFLVSGPARKIHDGDPGTICVSFTGDVNQAVGPCPVYECNPNETLLWSSDHRTNYCIDFGQLTAIRKRN